MSGFWQSKTIDQLIAEQGIQPITDIGVLAGVIPDEDLDEFLAEMNRQPRGTSLKLLCNSAGRQMVQTKKKS